MRVPVPVQLYISRAPPSGSKWKLLVFLRTSEARARHRDAGGPGGANRNRGSQESELRVVRNSNTVLLS
eukprot:scaffold23438_cov50-Attheya_sp.AAC.11